MLKTIITDAIVSPGYEGSPALKFSEKGDAARFPHREEALRPQRRTAATLFAPLNYPAPGISRIRNVQLPHHDQPTLDSPAPEMLHCGHLL